MITITITAEGPKDELEYVDCDKIRRIITENINDELIKITDIDVEQINDETSNL